MTDLLLKDKLSKFSPEEVRNVARIRTLVVLRELDSRRKGSVALFLKDAGLIDREAVIDLSRADLRQSFLAFANLSRVNISEADLSGADMRRANLSKSYLSGANLSEADLSGANLGGTDLFESNLSGANLTQARLSEANLNGADLRGCRLNEADLCGADLSGVNLNVGDLVGANLRGAKMGGAKLLGADLRQADLSRAGLFWNGNHQHRIGESLIPGRRHHAGWDKARLTKTFSSDRGSQDPKNRRVQPHIANSSKKAALFVCPGRNSSSGSKILP